MYYLRAKVNYFLSQQIRHICELDRSQTCRICMLPYSIILQRATDIAVVIFLQSSYIEVNWLAVATDARDMGRYHSILLVASTCSNTCIASFILSSTLSRARKYHPMREVLLAK